MIVPLAVAVPLAIAGLIALTGRFVPDWTTDVAGIAAALTGAVLTGILFERTSHTTVVYWFGGWRPKAGQFPLGISFAVDRIGAGLALLAFVLAAAVLVYSWRYLEDAHYLFETLVLLFAAAMAGFAFSGDLFNMFVFFELMGVCAYALTAYKVEEEPALQAAFNFAVTNSIGAFLVVLGLALVYGRTGSLNLAELGHRLAGRHDGLVIVAFSLIVCGFLVKAAIVPFHFWMADGYAAAPAPVCVLFAGVMSDLGLYAVGRVYWTVFAGSLGGGHAAFRDVLLAFGAATALVGALMCALQRHLKRLLAYSTIAELGVILIGVALLSPEGTAGAAVTVVAHGLAIGALFMAAGLLLVQFGEVDELLLYGKGRANPLLGVAWLLGALALASPPFLGTFTAHDLIGDAAKKAGDGWVEPVIAVATIVSTAAIVRAGARVFLGIGSRSDPLLSTEPREAPAARENPSVTVMTTVTLVLALAGLAVGASTGFAVGAREAAHGFVDHGAYLAAVLWHRGVPHAPPQHWVTTASGLAWASGTLCGSFAWGAVGLYRDRLPGFVVSGALTLLRPIKAAHTGHIGDYVAWLTCGVAVIGGLFALTLH